MRSIICGLIFAMFSGGTAAQEAVWPVRGVDLQHWEAVGRLELAGDAFCTGALIAPDIVLTAAHCLFDPANGARVAVADIQFIAGWRDWRPTAYRRVARAVPHPGYVFGAPAGRERVRNDLALVVLQHPIRATEIAPFATGPGLEDGATVGVVSYAHDRSQAPTLQEACEVMARQAGMMILSCPVDFGASGSPVFAFGEDGAVRIVSVVSAKAEVDGTPVALATELRGPLEALRAALAQAMARAARSAEEATFAAR